MNVHQEPAAVPGSDLHQFLPAALCQVWFLRQRLRLQSRTKQPEQNLLLLSSETLTACEKTFEVGDEFNPLGQHSFGVFNYLDVHIHTHLSAPRCSTARS